MTGNRLRLQWCAAMFLAGAFIAFHPAPLSAQAAGNGSLTVRVTGIRSTDGNIRVALRRDENTVVEAREVEIDAKTMTAQAVFEKVPEGAYGVAVIHDENKNGKLDFNEMGVPVEGYGHSNNPGKRMGPPNFDETKFTVTAAATAIEVKLIYWM